MKFLTPILIVIAVVVSGCGRFEKVISIPIAEIQEMVSQKFPYDKNAIVARLTVQSPSVYTDGEKIGMSLEYYGNYMEKEISGKINFKGLISYRPKNGSFYFDEFSIEEISVDQSAEQDFEKLEVIVTNIVSNYLDSYPVYRLNQNDFKQNLARLLLKDLEVREDSIVATLGI